MVVLLSAIEPAEIVICSWAPLGSFCGTTAGLLAHEARLRWGTTQTVARRATYSGSCDGSNPMTTGAPALVVACGRKNGNTLPAVPTPTRPGGSSTLSATRSSLITLPPRRYETFNVAAPK